MSWRLLPFYWVKFVIVPVFYQTGSLIPAHWILPDFLSSSTIFFISLTFQTFALHCDSIEKPLGYRFLNALTTSGSKSLTPSNWFPNVTLEMTKNLVYYDVSWHWSSIPQQKGSILYRMFWNYLCKRLMEKDKSDARRCSYESISHCAKKPCHFKALFNSVSTILIVDKQLTSWAERCAVCQIVLFFSIPASIVLSSRRFHQVYDLLLEPGWQHFGNNSNLKIILLINENILRKYNVM